LNKWSVIIGLIQKETTKDIILENQNGYINFYSNFITH